MFDFEIKKNVQFKYPVLLQNIFLNINTLIVVNTFTNATNNHYLENEFVLLVIWKGLHLVL